MGGLMRESLVPFLAATSLAGWLVAVVVMAYASRLQRRYLDLWEKSNG